jgi:proline dehydrogenase
LVPYWAWLPPRFSPKFSPFRQIRPRNVYSKGGLPADLVYMLRRTLLLLSGQTWLRHWMETSPASRRFTSRFIAGRTLDEALRVASQLAGDRILTSLDFLGENVTSIDEAAASRDSYLNALDGIAGRHLPATVSIKLTQFGLDLSEQICLNNVSALVERAKNMGTRVEIDMESAAHTDRTLGVVLEMHRRFGGHVRAVVQAYLRRSEEDLVRLSRERIPVRLCKGAYREPADVAFQQKAEVDRNYLALMKTLLEIGEYPAIASHDEAILDECVSHVRDKEISPDRFEFQMLYGIRRDLQRKLTQGGFRLRAYVPYGDAWFPYFMRRLAERPANLLFVAKNVLRG